MKRVKKVLLLAEKIYVEIWFNYVGSFFRSAEFKNNCNKSVQSDFKIPHEKSL